MLVCGLILLNRFWPVWGPGFDNSRMIVWDSYGYYLYLPATFIYDDPGLENREWIAQLSDKYHPSPTFYQVTAGQNGRLTIMYSMGTAVLWSPFFFIAHALAEPLGYPADGLSPPYSWAILIGGLLYAFIGLWFLRKVLLRFFSDGVTAVVLILITMGTNYWAQTASDTIMPHSTLFALNCVILWCVVRWHETKSYGHAIALGALIGLGTLSRPTEIFWAIVPFLWEVTSWRTFADKLKLFIREWRKVLLMCLAASAFIFLQLCYWKFTSGNWVFYSYKERFNWTSPFLLKALFSYKKGWLVYTPLMLFAFWGFYFMWKNARKIFLAVTVCVFIFTWMIMSWECWWYAACFSLRPMVEIYPLLTLPLGFLVVHIYAERKWYRIPVTIAISFVLLLNLFQHWQFNHGIIDGERMTKAYYWSVFGTTQTSPPYADLLEVDHWPVPEVLPDVSRLKKVDSLYLDFEATSSYKNDSIKTDNAYNSERSLSLGEGFEYGPVYDEVFSTLTTEDHVWLHASVWICYDTTAGDKQPPLLTYNYIAKDRSLKYLAYAFDTSGIRPGEWRLLQADFITPYPLYPTDNVTCMIWNPGRVHFHMDDFRVEVYEPKSKSEFKAQRP